MTQTEAPPTVSLLAVSSFLMVGASPFFLIPPTTMQRVMGMLLLVLGGAGGMLALIDLQHRQAEDAGEDLAKLALVLALLITVSMWGLYLMETA